ncbi:MAG: hypothetical protein AB9907_15605 [Flexilinea sp.]
MKEFICPFCGSSNSEDSEFCRICKVDFRQLPKDIIPKDEQKTGEPVQPDFPPKESLPDNSAEIPKWLSDIMNRNRKSQGKMPFDSFADVLFGIKPADDAPDAEKEDFSGNERIEDLVNRQKKGLPENPQESFDIQPEPSTPDETPSPISSYDKNSNLFHSTLNGDGQLEIPDLLSADSEISEEESGYSDFSRLRPAQKWDDQPVSGTESRENLPDDDGFDSAVISSDNEVNDPLSEPDVESGAGVEITAAEKAAEPDDSRSPAEEESLLSSEADEISTEIQPDTRVGIPEVENEQIPAVPDEINIETGFAEDLSENAGEDTRLPDQERIENESDSEFEKISDDLIDENQAGSEEQPAEAAADAEDQFSDFGEENLVNEFLSQFGTEDTEEGKPENQVIEPPSEEPAEIAADFAETIEELESEIQPSVTDEQPVSDIVAEPAEDSPDSISDEEQQAVSPDNSDDIPWNLFETGEMTFPENRIDPAYKTFSRNKIPLDYHDHDYQHRMITAVLNKLFQIESQNSRLKQAATRKTNKLLQFILALAAFAGVLTLLISGVTDFIDLNPVETGRMAGLSGFEKQIENLNAGDQALVIIDFTSGFSNELFQPSEQLIRALAERDVEIRLATISPTAEIISQKIIRENPDLPIENIGFMPGMMIAVQSLILTDAEKADSVFISSSNFDTLQTWIEQTAFTEIKPPVNVIASAQMNALLVPYYNSGLIDSLLTGTLEKSVFTGNDFSNKSANRKLFGVWFLCLMAILIYFTGSFDISTDRTAGDDVHSAGNVDSADPDSPADPGRSLPVAAKADRFEKLNFFHQKGEKR